MSWLSFTASWYCFTEFILHCHKSILLQDSLLCFEHILFCRKIIIQFNRERFKFILHLWATARFIFWALFYQNEKKNIIVKFSKKYVTEELRF